MALTFAPPKILPPVMLPVAEINPPVSMLPPVTLPPALNGAVVATIPVPAVIRLMLPFVAVVCRSRLAVLSTTIPATIKLPAVMLPVVLIGFDPNAAKLATTLALP